MTKEIKTPDGWPENEWHSLPAGFIAERDFDVLDMQRSIEQRDQTILRWLKDRGIELDICEHEWVETYRGYIMCSKCSTKLIYKHWHHKHCYCKACMAKDKDDG